MSPYKSRINNIRDYSANPISVKEAIALFHEENGDLAVASQAVILAASDQIDNGDIVSRWEDYQEELRHLMADFM